MGNEQGNYQNRPGDYSSSSRSFSNADPFSSLPSSAGASRPLPPPPPTSPKPAMPHSATYSSPFVSPPSRPSTASAAATSSSAQQTQAASSPQGEPLRFHKTLFGKNVTLTGDRIATRDPNSFDNGVVFTDRPLVAGPHVMLRFISPQMCASFEACPSVGLSSRNPDSLRREDLPSNIEGWGRPGGGIWSSTIENLTGGDILDFWLTDDRSLMWKKRGMDRGALLRVPSQKRPPEPLWLFIDLHGIINEVQIVESGDGDPTSSSSVSELQRSRSTLSDQALAEQLSTALAFARPAATSYASSSRPAPKMTNSSSLFESEWESLGAEGRTLSSLRTAESSRSRGDESNSSRGSESSRSRGGESSRSSGSAGGSSNLSQSNLFESNFLYDEFMGARTKMNLAYKTAPKQHELRGSAFEYKGVKIVVAKGNIEDEQTDAIVNSTSSDFNMGGAISKAIGRRAGNDWIESCKRIGHLDDVYLTDAPNLDCQKVIHLKAPSNTEECSRLAIKALVEAVSCKLTSISFPMIGTGGQNLEPYDVAQVLTEVVTLAADKKQLQGITKVRFVAFEDYQYELFLMTVKDAIQKASSQQQAAQSEPPPTPRPSDLPANWMPMREHELCLQIELKAGDPEFEKIKALFEAEKAKKVQTATFIKDRTLAKVFRVQNSDLYRQYNLTKGKFARKYHNKPDVLKNLERTLFHGTADGTVSKINSEGFDRSFCGKNLTLYGKGVYFARDLSYSCDPTYSPPNANKVKSVYVVKALVGVHTLGKRDMPNLPEQSPGVPFDCAVNEANDPTVFVIFRDYQTYPEYIMHIV